MLYKKSFNENKKSSVSGKINSKPIIRFCSVLIKKRLLFKSQDFPQNI